jgi:exodeoxyribonuclease III
MKMATWNVNSLNVRLAHVSDWLSEHRPDVLCLQETKLEDIKFPFEYFREQGYNAIHNGQKTYNGVAILSPHPIEEIQMNIPDFQDEQKRVIAANIKGLRIVCAYIPNGQDLLSDKYSYKLKWLEAFIGWIKRELENNPQLAILGDYNIAPQDIDCHDPVAWQGQVLVSPAERQAFQDLLDLGLSDIFRNFFPNEVQYSWWDYRMAAFRRNLGMRIDHILVSPELLARATTSYIDKAPRQLERPSDHTPVVMEFTA